MVPSLTLEDLVDLPEFKAFQAAIRSLESALRQYLSWSIFRDEHDERSKDTETITRLEQDKRDELESVLMARARLFSASQDLEAALLKALRS